MRQRFPEVALVFGSSHILSEYSRMLDVLRSQEAKSFKGPMRKIIKGERFLLLKRQERLTIPAREKLFHLLLLNEPLFKVYVLKEELRRLWKCDSKEEDHRFLLDWIRKASASVVKKLAQFALRIARHLEGILSYFRYPIKMAMVKGINNKIKLIKRKAYGYRDIEYFKMKIYNSHLATYSFL